MENVKINTTPKGAKGICYASQYDDGRIVRFNLFSELLPYKLDGSETIKVKVVRPDNVEIIEAVTNTEDYYIDVNISSDMTALAGVASCELEIKKGDMVIGSRNFDLNIERDSYGEDITVETVSGAIATFTTNVIDLLQEVKCEINATGGNGTPDNPNPINGYTEANITANGNTYTIAFGQTVYGGVLDVTRGKLHVTYGGVSATASDTVAGQVHTSNNGWAFTLSNKDAIYKQQGNAISNINVVTIYGAATTSGFVTAISTLKPLFFLADSDTGLDGTATLSQVQSAFETFCNNYNPFAIYELATPFDIDLTPQQIEALLGANNVWSDTNGETEVKFYVKES